MTTSSRTTKQWFRKRRSQRIDLNVPVVVYRPAGEGPQFYESTQTLVVSAHGALIALTDMLAPKQRLLVQNTDSGEQQECHALSVKCSRQRREKKLSTAGHNQRQIVCLFLPL